MGILNSTSGRFDESLKADKISTLQALIFASKKVDDYKVVSNTNDKKFSRKEKVMIRTIEAFDLYKEGGRYTYGGPTIEDVVKYIDGSATKQELEELNKKSFNKNYQDGGALGIWINSELELSDLANRVANHEITISRYLSIVFLNLFSYATNDKGEIEYFHFLDKVLNYLRANKNLDWKIDLDILDKVFYHFRDESTEFHKKAQRRALYQYLVGTEYFVAEEGNFVASLAPHWQKNVELLISICNQEYKELSFDEAKEKFKSKKVYSNALCKNPHEKIIAKISEGIALEENTLVDLSAELVFNTKLKSEFLHNRIIFGAPGTGKSFMLNTDKDKLLKNGGEFERVTFHEDYSYAHFVGTYKPTMVDNSNQWVNLSIPQKEIISVLRNPELSGQKKYDYLYDKFLDDGNNLTSLPILIGLYSNDLFMTKKKDGTQTSNNNSVERNHGRALRPFVSLFDENTFSEIAYEYIPGPFMRMYVKALKNAQTKNPTPHLLIIEEINRATVARVFGDVFQLLDRDKNDVSEYSIEASEDIKKYLSKELGGKPEDYQKIKIPNNMFLWATMNSADQGVKPMDTAFKRRWDFDYLGINDGEEKISGKKVKLGTGEYEVIVEWNSLRKAINDELMSYKLNEDKLLGPFFLSLKVLGKEKTIDSTKFNQAFKSKILMYLFEDAAKAKRRSLFYGVGDDYNCYSAIIKTFDEKGIYLFGPSIWEKFE